MKILFLNPQGNFDKTDAFWTEHPDFGGQLVYVKEIAFGLAKLGHDIDIVTRQFEDSHFHLFHETIEHYDDEHKVRIVRIPCGPKGFLNKESLWDYLSEWVDHIISFYQVENHKIDFITTHYGDGGLAGVMLSKKLNIPFSFTGHSLGAQKLDKLMTHSTINQLIKTYHFGKRLLAERTAIRYARTIFVSTKQEKDMQYQHHAYKDVADIQKEKRFVIAPPGANLDMFAHNRPNQNEAQYHFALRTFIKRDIDMDRQNMPYIVCASRLDPKKNHIGLLNAYASSTELQNTCNLAISLRGVDNAFEDISSLKPSEQALMQELLHIIEIHHLKGKVTFLNITSQSFLAASYRFFATYKSIFTLTSLYEPFGLAPIEAMAAGLPVAVTQYGGPSEVLKGKEAYGILLDVKDINHMVEGYLLLFKHYYFYQKQGLKRVYDTYNWLSTAKVYEDAIRKALNDPLPITIHLPQSFIDPNQTIDEKAILQTYYLDKKE